MVVSLRFGKSSGSLKELFILWAMLTMLPWLIGWNLTHRCHWQPSARTRTARHPASRSAPRSSRSCPVSPATWLRKLSRIPGISTQFEGFSLVDPNCVYGTTNFRLSPSLFFFFHHYLLLLTSGNKVRMFLSLIIENILSFNSVNWGIKNFRSARQK